MLLRFVVFLSGFGLSLVGLVYMICILNILAIGYNMVDYVNFIIKRFEFYYIFIGFITMILAVYLPGGEKNDLYL